MKKIILASVILLIVLGQASHAVMESGDYPWSTELRSFLDRKGPKNDGAKVPWLLNLGPTGIRARIYPKKANLLVVKYVFEDKQSPAHGKVKIEDVIAGANGKPFKTNHRFGRRLKGGGGWDGPLMELAGHIEDSQGKDGVLNLIVWPKGDKRKQKVVPIQLKRVGRFSPTFPFNCPRSEKLLEELCDFMVADYKSGNWKSANSFYGGPHGRAHQMLAMMASGISKYDSIIKKEMSGYSKKKYDPASGGFQCWNWGFDGILMGEYYLLTKDKKLVRPIKSLVECMPWGSFMQNGVYAHRSHINIRKIGRKPYASIAAISGLQMIAMSIFQVAGLPYDTQLHETIHQLYLGSTAADAVNIAYAFGGQGASSNGRDARHAIIKLKNASLGKSGKGPGYLCPTGMKGITDYSLVWPTKKDPRWKPTDWIAKEAKENTVEELQGDIRRVDRYLGPPASHKEPTRAYSTKKSGGHLAPVGMGAVAHLIGNKDKISWEYLGRHAANTCVLGPGNAFDGHAASNLHGFWSVLGAARSDNPTKLREYFDYMKTFIILSKCHNGGLYLQPWGRDRPGCNSDTSYGPRLLPTATGAILLSLPKKRLQVTGAGSSSRTPAAARSTRKRGTTTTTTGSGGPAPGGRQWPTLKRNR